MRSEWWVSLIAVLLVVGGLAVGAYIFRQKARDKQIQQQIALIESLQAEKRYDQALAQIEALAPKVRQPQTQRHLERLAVQTLMRVNKTDEARQRAEAFLEANPDDPHLGTILYCLGKIALEQEHNRQKAAGYFEKVVRRFSSDRFYPGALLGLANVDVQLGDLLSAKSKLDELIELPLESDLKPSVEDLLGQVNTALLFSRNQLPGDQFYEVQPGDAPIRIAQRFGIQVELLQRCNGIKDPRALRAGRRLKIPNVDFSIVVNLSDNTLTLVNHGKFFRKYRVRTGRFNGLTPTGQFAIRTKLENPQWEDPATGKIYAPGHPENELATRWMGFDRAGLGIHGTIHPESIGQYASRGCIGMLTEEVEELYDLVPRGTPVTIVGERRPPDYSAAETPSETENP